MRTFLISIFLSVVFASASYACGCGEWDFDSSVESSDEIFIGELIRVERDKYPFVDAYELKYVFEVSKKWKGNSSDRIEIFRESGCAPFLDIDYPNEYIIYAYPNYTQFAEVLAEATGETSFYKNFNYIGNRMTTNACLRLKEVNWYEKEAPFRDEIALLDNAFVQPVSLRPYYLNFTNLFLLVGIIITGIYFGKKNTKLNSEED